MLSVVTFLWRGGRAEYGADHVNCLLSMFGRSYRAPFKFFCVTNHPDGLSRDIEVVEDEEAWAEVGPDIPYYREHARQSCYRRLRLYGPGARAIFGERVLMLDLDLVIAGDVTQAFDRPEDVVLLEGTPSANPAARNPYNGAVQLVTADARPQVWHGFDPDRSPTEARARGYGGTDQAWLAHVLGPNEATFKAEDGFLSWRAHCQPNGDRLPEGAKVVNFSGRHKPWELADRVDWIRSNYR